MPLIVPFLNVIPSLRMIALFVLHTEHVLPQTIVSALIVLNTLDINVKFQSVMEFRPILHQFVLTSMEIVLHQMLVLVTLPSMEA